MRLAALRPPTRLSVPGWSYFAGSAVFHYLGPSFAVLLFAQVAPAGVAALRIWTAAAVFALWRRPWRVLARLDRGGRLLVVAWGLLLAVMTPASTWPLPGCRWVRSPRSSSCR